MGLSFQLDGAPLPTRRDLEGLPVLVTGAAGKIGRYFAEHAREKYRFRLMAHSEDDREELETFGEFTAADIGDLEALKKISQGIDTVVHLAANPSPSATWESLLQANIIGAYHMMVAAKAAGCRRLIYASSIHAVSGYPAETQVKSSDPVNPGDLYGVTKCFGEALGRYMAEQEGLSVIALRIGAFQPLESAHGDKALRLMDAFVSRRDLTELIERCIAVDGLKFAILNALSGNRFNRLDISDARALAGYHPQDDFTQENEMLRELHLSERVMLHNRREGGQDRGIREELQ